MNFYNKKGFQILLCLLIFLYEWCTQAMPTTKDTDITEKVIMSETDLLRNYETLSRNAVTRDTRIVSNMGSEKDKYVSINNGQDFNIPINDNIMSQPIGTYQYIDVNGDLHIVNFINDQNGLRILNDYKPYASLESRNKLKNMRSNDLKPKNSERESKGNNEFSNEKHSVGEQTDKDINYDEYEFTFMPQGINKSIDKNKNQINDLNSDESHKNIDKLSSNEELNKLVPSNNNNYYKIQELTKLMNSMPLPQPFSVPSHSPRQFFEQMPVPTNDNWRGPPLSHSFSYGMQSQGFAPNYGFQPLLTWNY